MVSRRPLEGPEADGTSTEVTLTGQCPATDCPHESPKGGWGRFLDGKRSERGWSQQRAFEELHTGLGLGPKSRASYVALEEGHEPTPDQQRFLARFYGEGPGLEDEEPNAAATLPATEALSLAVRTLADELSAVRAARDQLAAELRLLRGPVESPNTSTPIRGAEID